jgi:putative F0F1-ATPase subunit (Ca2+/Mg2+ transporter)
MGGSSVGPTANGPFSSPPYLRITVVGLEFASPILAGLVGGYYLGEYFHRPWLGLLGLVGGVFLGFYRLIWELRRFMKATR